MNTKHREENRVRRLPGMGPGEPSGIKETPVATENKEGKYNPGGQVLDRLMKNRGIGTTELGRRMVRRGFTGKNPRRVIQNAMLPDTKGVYFDVMPFVIDALELLPQEQNELIDGFMEHGRQIRRDDIQE